MKKLKLIGMVAVVLGVLFYLGMDISSVTGVFVGEVDSVIEDSGAISIYFCPRDDCETALVGFLDSAEESIDCALFDIGLSLVQAKLLEKSAEIPVRVVTDNDYVHKFNYSFVHADSWGLMHNKFCVIDGVRVSTGSMNPTDNGAHKNNNNLLLIDSAVLSQNYLAEFEEMWNGTFKKGDKVLNPVVDLDGVILKNYFCPEDSCAEHVKEELEKAEESIHFMIFSFTHDGIANVMLIKNQEGVLLRGVMEARQVSKYSKFEVLKYQGIDVLKDGNKNNLHHKVFIIDGKTVVTGSFNPSAGGDSRNDENVLVIEDSKIAGLFMEEWEKVWEEAELKELT